MVVRVLPGEQRRARGAALRGRGDVVGELGAMAREQPRRVRHHPVRELTHGLIVGLDQDDVGPAGRCAGVGTVAARRIRSGQSQPDGREQRQTAQRDPLAGAKRRGRGQAPDHSQNGRPLTC